MCTGLGISEFFVVCYMLPNNSSPMCRNVHASELGGAAAECEVLCS